MGCGIPLAANQAMSAALLLGIKAPLRCTGSKQHCMQMQEVEVAIVSYRSLTAAAA